MTPSAPRDPEPIDCEAAVRRLWDYLDHELDASRGDAVRAHLAGCAECRPHFDFAARMQAAVAEAHADAVRLDVGDVASLRARVVSALRAVGPSGRG